MNILTYVIILNELLLIYSGYNKISTFWHFSNIFWNSSIEVCNNKNQTVQNCVTQNLLTILEQNGGIIPDFIFWTCAGGPYIEIVCNAFKTALHNKSIPVLPSLPRADNSYLLNYTILSNYFSSWLDKEAIETFSKHGYYSIIPKIPYNLKIIVLNSELFCNPDQSNTADDQWKWLFLELKMAKKENLKVYILLSMAPGITTTFENKQFTIQQNRHYITMVRMHSDIIKGQFAGYEMGNKFRIFTQKNGTSSNWMMLAPSFVNHSRLYIYDKKTLEVLDYIQFYKKNDRWLMEHRFTHFFLIPNISIFSLNLLVHRMKNGKEILNKYAMVSYQPQARYKEIPCKITTIDYNEYLKCIERTNLIRTTPSPHENDCTITYNNYFTIPLLFVLSMLL